MNSKKYSVSIKTPAESPMDYAVRALEAGRRKAGNELYGILYSQKLPAVIDIEEIYIPAEQGNFDTYPKEHELRIVITVTPVEHRHI